MSKKYYLLTNSGKDGKVNSKDRWLSCPVCGKKRLLHLLPKTEGKNIAVYCRQCKQEIVFDIVL